MDQEQFFEELAKKYPALMKKSLVKYIGVGPGWYKIIDDLCANLCAKYLELEAKLPALSKPTTIEEEILKKEIEQELSKLEENLPAFTDIKEKFGTLRVYCMYGDDTAYDFIDIAENSSRAICEKCGRPGILDDTHGWTKVLCELHRKERKSDPTFSIYKDF